MYLKDFKQHIESFPKGYMFKHKLSEPFSWRGSYSEVAFDISLNTEQTREEALEMINEAYTREFRGYKGGKYTYNDYTEVYFEPGSSSWSDGGYTARLISQIENEEEYTSQEMILVKKAFI